MRISSPATLRTSHICASVICFFLALPPFVSASEPARRVLPNGVIAIVEERHDVPIVALRTYIRTGSIYEGKYLGSGISHLLEHMFFVGTKTRTKTEIFDLRENIGNAYNGFTGHELMHFFVIITPQNFQPALDLFSDCVKNLNFPEDELINQREIIHEEMDTWRNNLLEVLRNLQYQTMFRVHPVRHPIKGYREQFDRLTRADIRSYYESAFVPENIVVVVVGDIEETTAFAKITKAFGDMPSRTASVGDAASHALERSERLPAEPPQHGVCRAALKRKGIKTAYLSMGYRTVSITEKDAPVLDLLATLLTETRGAFLRLLLLGKRRLAYNVKAYVSRPGTNTGMFAVRVISDPLQIDAAEKAILGEIERTRTIQLDPAMLHEAKKLLRARQVFRSETVQDRANQLGMDEVKTGDYQFSDKYLGRLEQVSVEEIQRALSKYFSQDNLSVATIIPARAGEGLPDHGKLEPGGKQKKQIESGKVRKWESEKGKRGKSELSFSIPSLQTNPVEQTRPKPRQRKTPAARQTQGVRLKNGLKLLMKQNRVAPSAAIVAAFGGGLRAETEEANGISNLVASLLLKGTKARSSLEIAGPIKRKGGRIRAFAEEDAFGVTINCLKEDVPLALEIIAEVAQNAKLNENYLEREKRMLLGAIRRRDDNPLKFARVKFCLAAASNPLFSAKTRSCPTDRKREKERPVLERSEGTRRRELSHSHFPTFPLSHFLTFHPYGLPKLGTEDSVKRITFEHILSFHKRFCAPNNLVLSICGDIDYDGVQQQIEKLFNPDDWPARPREPASSSADNEHKASATTLSQDKANARIQADSRAKKVVIEKPGIPEAAIYFGYPGVRLTDPDCYALEVLDGVLSGIRAPGGRLHRRLRDKGLVYVVHAKNEMHKDGGFFRGYALCAPPNVGAVLKIIAEEVRKVRDEAISENELSRAKNMCITLRAMDRQTNESQAKQAALDAICGVGYAGLGAQGFASGKLEPIAYTAGIKGVTREDVQRVAREYLNCEWMTTIIIRPEGN